MSSDERIADKELERLLLATVEDLLRYELALRDDGYLIFPSQLTRERHDLPDPPGKTTFFAFEGATRSIYTRLVVRLSRSGLFTVTDMWRNAVTYRAVQGTCGMWLRERDEGEGELVIFYPDTTGEATKYHFEQYVETELRRRTLPESVKRRRIFICDNCGEPMNESHVRRRLDMGLNTMTCPVCDNAISLLSREEHLQTVPESKVTEIDRAADAGRDHAVHAITIEGKIATNDFDVFMCHNSDEKR